MGSRSRARCSTARAPSTPSPPGGPSATRCSSAFPSTPSSPRPSPCEPRQGNPPPRLWETPAGLINSIGLPNKGLEGFLAQRPAPAGRAPGAAGGLGDGLHAGRPGRAGRRGWPSATRWRWSSSTSPAPTWRAGWSWARTRRRPPGRSRRCAPAPSKPVIVKLTPNATEPAAVAAAAEGAGADARLPAQHPQGHGARPRHAAALAGRTAAAGCRAPRCGPWRWSRSPRSASGSSIPVVGMGGIATAADAADFLAAGRPRGGCRHRELPRSGRRRSASADELPRCRDTPPRDG